MVSLRIQRIGHIPHFKNAWHLDCMMRQGLHPIIQPTDPAWENVGKDGGRRCAFPPYPVSGAISVVWGVGTEDGLLRLYLELAFL